VNSPRTFGCVNELMLGERNQGLIVIPPGVYHGWKNIGADEATIVSMPSELYNDAAHSPRFPGLAVVSSISAAQLVGAPRGAVEQHSRVAIHSPQQWSQRDQKCRPPSKRM